MTVSEFLKAIEGVDPDKKICIVAEVLSEDEANHNVMLRDITGVIENSDIVGII